VRLVCRPCQRTRSLAADTPSPSSMCRRRCGSHRGSSAMGGPRARVVGPQPGRQILGLPRRPPPAPCLARIAPRRSVPVAPALCTTARSRLVVFAPRPRPAHPSSYQYHQLRRRRWPRHLLASARKPPPAHGTRCTAVTSGAGTRGWAVRDALVRVLKELVCRRLRLDLLQNLPCAENPNPGPTGVWR
jgi:hypothetical protein